MCSVYDLYIVKTKYLGSFDNHNDAARAFKPSARQLDCSTAFADKLVASDKHAHICSPHGDPNTRLHPLTHACTHVHRWLERFCGGEAEGGGTRRGQ